MRILYFLSALVLAVVLIVGCTGDPKGIVDPVNKTGLVPPPAGGACSEETGTCDGVSPCTPENAEAGLFYFPSCLGCDKFVQCSEWGQLYIMDCPTGTVWDQDVLSCVAGDPTTCTPPSCSGAADPCDPNPCVNGGQCADNGDGSYTCTCAPGYTGDICDTEIDECAANPCVNGACNDLVNGYTCECLPGWTGTNCDNPEVTDADGDGVADNADNCANTASGDVVDATGCSIAQYCPCDNNWKNHGAYVSCVAHSAENFVDAGLITEAQKGTIVSAAAQSNCGKKK